MNCPRCGTELVQIMTRRGVIADICPAGHGFWIDGGEIYFFIDDPKKFDEAIRRGLSGGIAKGVPCPRCANPRMDNGKLDGKGPLIDMCGKCHGIWFDKGELTEINKAFGGKLDPYMEVMDDFRKTRLAERMQQPAPPTPGDRHPSSRSYPSVTQATVIAARAALPHLRGLALSSIVSMSALYGLLFVVFAAVTIYTNISIHFAFAFALVFTIVQFLIAPWMMDLSLRWFNGMTWVGTNDLPKHLVAFISKTTELENMPFPRIGMIHDGTPNAFTYGRSPRDARIVITQGLIDILSPEELEAVVAHEIGHARHWDILIMTIAGFVPVLLYYIYDMLRRSRGGRGDSAKIKFAVIIIAYIAYLISQYIVLYISRVREYLADRFSGEKTAMPNALAIALVKIAYGLAGMEKEKPAENQPRRRSATEAIKTFGVFDPIAAKSLAISSLASGSVTVENAAGAMRWDMWNPWATFYELNSTHPLPAKRIRALASQAQAYGQQPAIVFNETKPESYWDEFLVDLLVMLLPLAGAAAGLAIAFATGGANFAAVPICFGVAYALNLLFSYRNGPWHEMTVSALLKNVKVSAVRPVPVTLKGKIIGRGVPGLIWSEDMVMQDATGYIFLDYAQPFRIFEFLFGLFRTQRFMGTEVTVEGWYRRAPVPYIEVRRVTAGNTVNRCYVYALKWAFAVSAITAGFFVMASSGF